MAAIFIGGGELGSPQHLSKRSRAVWAEVDETFEIDAARRIMLQTALEALDRYNEAREKLNAEGVCFTSETGVIHLHPATRIEKESRDGFIKAWRSLDLDMDPPQEVL